MQARTFVWRWLLAGALVLGLSPSALAQAPRSISGTLTSASPSLTLGVEGLATWSGQLTGTWSGTVTYECTSMGTFTPSLVKPVGSATGVTTATSNGFLGGPTNGASQCQVRFSTPTSGTVEVTLRAILSGGDNSTSAAGAGAGTSDTLEATQLLVLASLQTLDNINSVAHDAAAAAINPTLTGCYSSAAAPSDVSADNDATREWCLRNGARAVQLTNAGVLTLSGSGTATSALRVELPTNGTGVVGLNAGANVIGSLAANQTVNIAQYGGTAVYVDPCLTSTPSVYVVNVATNTTVVFAAASASNKNYVCHIELFSAGTNNVAIVEDATGSCASPDAGMVGGTTTGTGYNLIAQTGVVAGNGNAWVMKTASTNVNSCLITSASVQLTGVIRYVQAP